MVMGRPPKYESEEEMQKLIDLYFLACKVRTTGKTDMLEGLSEDDLLIINDIPSNIPSVAGLAYTLNLTRQGLIEYGRKDDFSYTVKRAKQRIEIFLEESLYNNGCTGSIFNLKNNFGWKDKNETEYTGKDGGPIETKSTLEAGPGVSRVLQALGAATSTGQDNSNEGGDKE